GSAAIGGGGSCPCRPVPAWPPPRELPAAAASRDPLRRKPKTSAPAPTQRKARLVVDTLTSNNGTPEACEKFHSSSTPAPRTAQGAPEGLPGCLGCAAGASCRS